MHVQVKSASGISLVPMGTLQLAKRRVYLRGEINMDSACDLADQIMLLNDESATKPIDLFITSPGGQVQAGLMLFDVIHSSEAPVRMFCLGNAYSMAALLFATGRHGRYMLPHSQLMLHEPLLGSAVRGNASSVRTLSQELLAVSAQLNELLAQHTGRTMEEIEKACSYDHYFTAQESVDFGLADGTASYAQMKGEGTLWNLTSRPLPAAAPTAQTPLPLA